MSLDDLIVSVDIGTGATKAALFGTDVEQIAIVRKHYPIHTPRRGWNEQEPEVIFEAVVEALQEITRSVPEGKGVLGVSFSSQLCGVLAVGAGGEALTNLLIWSDARSAEIAQSISQRPEAQGIHQRTGCPIDAMYPLAKIQWLKENVELPENARFVSIKEYVIFRLIGQWVVDWAVASATGLFDTKQYRWDEPALSLVDVTPANLSELVPPRHVFRTWDEEIMDLIGLSPGTPLIIGGGDGQLSSIGVGACSTDTLAVNVGTSAAARLTISETEIDPQGQLWTYVVDEDLWVIGGLVSSGGLVYDWALRNFLPGVETTENGGSREGIYESADGLASAVPPGAEDLIFLPYLAGEQTPGWRPHTRGSFFGLDFGHSRGHLVRAVLEGITRSIVRVSENIERLLDGPYNEIRVSGGLTSSSLWLQIAADMFGTPVAVPETAEGSARGAAILAMISLGVRSALEDFADLVTVQKRVRPRQDVHTYYRAQSRKFEKLLDCARKL